MKKVIFILLLLLVGLFSYSQYPINQYIGSDSTLVTSRGALRSRLISFVFTDTAQANTQRISQYPGAIIFTEDGSGTVWVRNELATGWIDISSGGGVSVNIYNSDGTLLAARTVDMNGETLAFNNNGGFSIYDDVGGLTRFKLTNTESNLFAPDGGSGLLATNDSVAIVGNTFFNVNANTNLRQSFSLSGVISPPTITSDQNNYNPSGLATASTLRLDADAAWNITGIEGGTDGRILILHNIGSENITLVNVDVGSDPDNRFVLSSNYVMEPNMSIMLRYDGNFEQWRNAAGGGGSVPIATTDSNFAVASSQLLWRNWVNVKDYGAVMDGVTDDATALQAAIDAAGVGGTVFIPPTGTMLISTQVSMKYQQTLMGVGNNSKVYVTANIKAILLDSSTIVKDIWFNGPGKATGGTNNSALFISNSVDFQILNCLFTNFGGDNNGVAGGAISGAQIVAGYSVGGVIMGCTFDNNDIAIDLGNRAEYILIDGNRFSANNYGIYLQAGNTRIANNNFQDNTRALYMTTGSNPYKLQTIGNSFNHNTLALDLNGVTIDVGAEFTGNHYIAKSSIKLTNCSGVLFTAERFENIDSIHLDNTNHITMHNTYLGSDLTGIIDIPIKKYNGADDIVRVGIVRKVVGTPIISYDDVYDDTTFFRNVLHATNVPIGGSEDTLVLVLDPVTNQIVYRNASSIGGGASTTFLRNPLNADSLLNQIDADEIWVKSVSVEGIDPVEVGHTRTDSTILHTANIRQTFLDSIRTGEFGTAGATIELDNLGTTAINANLLPGADGTIDLGSGTAGFDDLFLDNAGVINFDNGIYTLTHAAAARLTARSTSGSLTDFRVESPNGSHYMMLRTDNAGGSIFDLSTGTTLSGRINNVQSWSISTTLFSINSAGSGQDFKWASASNTNALFGDASANSIGINNGSPSGAFMHVGAGTTTFSPFKLTSGTDLTTATVGSFEFGTVSAVPRLAFTPVGTSRRRFMLSDDVAPANGQIGIGNGTDYTAASVTSTGSTVTITPGAGTLNLEVATTLASGIHSPNLTNTTNIAASTAYDVQYMRVGIAVTVSGKVDITANATGAVELRMSVPITTANFTANEQAGGTAHPQDKTTNALGISAVVGADVVAFKFVADDTISHTYWFSYTYQILTP